MSASFSSIMALIMALCMLLSPAAGYDTQDVPAMTATIETSDGLRVSAGLTKTLGTLTEAGLPTVFLDCNGQGVTLTGETAYVTDGTGTYAVPVEELISLFSSGVQSMPEFTEDDLSALMIFAQGVMSGVSTDAFSFSVMGTGLSFSFDLDTLAHELHTVVPNVLNAYASYLDPTLTKYTEYLFDQPITAQQLAQVWPELGLDQVSTGLSAQLTVLETANALNIIGSIADVNFVLKLGEESLSLDLTTADGTTYTIDTADFATIAQIVSTATSYISTNAFSYEQTTTRDESYNDVITTTIKLDTAALSDDLNRGFAYAVALNSDTVDQLLNKYRTWIALLDEHLARRLTASFLIDAFNSNSLISLPAETGELVVVCNSGTGAFVVDGYFANITLQGTVFDSSYSSACSFILTYADRYDPLVLSVDFVDDPYEGQALTINSNVMLFNLFHTLTYTNSDYGYDLEWHVTTDTNALRIDFSDEEQYAGVKVGPLNAEFRVDENDFAHLELHLPEFFAELHTDDYGSIHFDSTIGGFDFTETRYGYTITGYLADHYRYRTTFGLTMSDSYDSQSLSGYLNTSDGIVYEASLHSTGIDLIINGDLYTIRAFDVDDADKVGLTLSMSSTPIMSLVLGSAESQVTAELYQGTDITVEPVIKLTLDADPAPYVAPADVTVVDAMTFFTKVDELELF